MLGFISCLIITYLSLSVAGTFTARRLSRCLFDRGRTHCDQNGRIKSSQNLPKLAIAVFTSKATVVKIAQNVAEYLGYFCWKNFTQRLLKSSPNWSHWSHAAKRCCVG